MGTPPKANDPAYPCTALQPMEGGGTYSRSETGMTLRQWYKGQVAAGIFTGLAQNEDGDRVVDATEASRYAGMLADALLAEDLEFEKREDGK